MPRKSEVWAVGLCLTALVAAGCSGAGTGNAAQAAEAELPADPIDQLNATLAQLGAEPASAGPSEIEYFGDPSAVYVSSAPRDIESEVALLREHVFELERSVTFYMDTVFTDLRNENAYLREELARIYATVPLEDQMRPLVPRPGSALINDLQDVAQSPEYQAQLHNPRIDSPALLVLKVAKEWGRTPEEAAMIGPAVTSLKGIIGSVQEGATDGALLEFARDLRDQFAEYTNINAVIFDAEPAAAAYAEHNRKSTPSHVLTIARHEQSGIDEIYLHRNGLVVHSETF